MAIVMTSDHFNGQDGVALLGWRMWTDDGSVYDSDSHSWAEVPADGAEVLFTYHWTLHAERKPTRMAWSGWDEYSLPGIAGGTKLGRLMDDDEFETLRLTAMADTWRPAGG